LLISKDEEKNLKNEKNPAQEIIRFFKLCMLLLQIPNENENEENFYIDSNEENNFLKNFIEKFLKEKMSLSKIRNY
jgi:hypothetical protein